MLPMPPDKGGFKREAGATPAQLSTVQRVVRFAESNDFLLYLTAIFGVLMPAVMYFFYRTVHRRYNEHNRRRLAAKRRERLEKKRSRQVVIFYCADSAPTRKSAYELAEEWDGLDPVVSALNGANVRHHLSSRAAMIFVIGEGSDSDTDECESFLNFLDEVRYERREKSFMDGAVFTVLALGDVSAAAPNTDAFHRKLVGLKATALTQSPTHTIQLSGGDLQGRVKQFATAHSAPLKQFYYGLYDHPPAKETSPSGDEESEATNDTEEEEI